MVDPSRALPSNDIWMPPLQLALRDSEELRDRKSMMDSAAPNRAKPRIDSEAPTSAKPSTDSEESLAMPLSDREEPMRA